MEKVPSIGILAGMGPRSTAPFLSMVIDECQRQYGAKNDEDFPPIFIYSLPTPFFIDRPLDHRKMSETICHGLKDLAKTKVDVVAMPCNVAHQYFENLEKCIHVPLLNMTVEAVKYLDVDHKRVAIIGTPSTIDSGMYQIQLNRRGFSVVEITELQPMLNAIIKGIKAGNDMRDEWKNFVEKLHTLKVEQAILACTDLNVLPLHTSDIKIVDATLVLAAATVAKYISLKEHSRT